MACHGNGAAIFYRNAEDLGRRPEGDRQLVAEGGGQDRRWRATIGAGRALRRIDLLALVDPGIGAQNWELVILDIIDQPLLGAIEPDIADHAMRGGMRPGRQRRMADDGLGVGMSMMGVEIDNALIEKIAKAAVAHAIEVTRDKIAAQLIHGDLENKLRRRLGGKCRNDAGKRKHRAEGCHKRASHHLGNSHDYRAGHGSQSLGARRPLVRAAAWP